MKPFLKAFFFLLVVWIFDLLLRMGLILHFIPFQLPSNFTLLVLFLLFVLVSYFITRWFCKKDHIKTKDLGTNYDLKNRLDFLYGFIIGFVLWAVVSLLQLWMAGFSWELRTNISFYHIIYGLIFIFIADLGTELFTRESSFSK